MKFSLTPTTCVELVYKSSYFKIFTLILQDYYLFISIDCLRLHLCRKLWIFSRSPIFHHGLGKSSNLWCSNYWKMHLRIKKVKVEIFTHALLGKAFPLVFIPRFLSSASDQAERIYSSPRQLFLKIYPPAERVEGNYAIVLLRWMKINLSISTILKV